MLKNLFCGIAILTITFNVNTWITLKKDGREFEGQLLDTTEVLVFKKGECLEYNKYHWRIHINFYERKDDVTSYTGSLGCKEYFNAPAVKCIASENWRYYVIHFEGGKFIICSLNYCDTHITTHYSSDMHPDLELSVQFPTRDGCVVEDKTGREIFVCNATTKESNLLVPSTSEVHREPVSRKKTGSCSII